jgi:hypothetical protein
MAVSARTRRKTRSAGRWTNCVSKRRQRRRRGSFTFNRCQREIVEATILVASKSRRGIYLAPVCLRRPSGRVDGRRLDLLDA